MINSDDIKKIKEVIINMMKQNFKADGKLFPVIMALEPNGKMTYVGTTYTNQEEKKKTLEYAKELCAKINAVALFMINEAWIKKIKPEDYENIMADMKKTGKRISDYGDRGEIGMMLFETKTSSQMITFDIDRTNNELINMMENPTEGGDFKNILCAIQTNTN